MIDLCSGNASKGDFLSVRSGSLVFDVHRNFTGQNLTPVTGLSRAMRGENCLTVALKSVWSFKTNLEDLCSSLDGACRC